MTTWADGSGGGTPITAAELNRMEARLPLLIESGAGVPGGTPVGTIIFEKATAVTTYDFTGGALPGSWTTHGSPSQSFSGAGMATTCAAGDGYHLSGVTLANDFTLDLYISAQGSYAAMFGPNVTDGSGNGAGANWFNAPAGSLVINLSSYAYGSSFNNSAGTPASPSVIRLIRSSGSDWKAAWSTDNGATFSTPSTAYTSSTTMTRIGFGCAFSGPVTATVSKVVYEASGATPTGTARGWWDGSTIQPIK